MAKLHITALDYIRGISMLGVLGIHTGAFSLANPAVSPHLFFLLEIFTRFSVPIFFFVSAFGLFISQPLASSFSYHQFMLRRLKAVLLPYLAWSLLYMGHYTLISGDKSIWKPTLVYKYFLFGLGSYQLYFLVILIWFYAMMPLWRRLVAQIIKKPIIGLSILLVFQIAFNYYSSYELKPVFANHYLNLLIEHRMSYLVLHYIFIFVLGAVCAELYPQFKLLLSKASAYINSAYFLTLGALLFFYYYLVYFNGYTLEGVVNTIHQLSPIGVLYTVTSTLFWFNVFSERLPDGVRFALTKLGDWSYSVYLIHPLAMYYLNEWLLHLSIPYTTVVSIGFYLLALAMSIGLAVIIKKISTIIPTIGLALTGATTKPNVKRSA